jgi:hypothetical protein
MNELLPCPFCGREVEDDLEDTLYPSGTWWREEDGLRHYIGHQERKPTDQPCWLMNCPESGGGCGAEIYGDTKEQVMAKWNRRAAPDFGDVTKVWEEVREACPDGISHEDGWTLMPSALADELAEKAAGRDQ